MVSKKLCPKCSNRDLNAFCGAIIKKMDGGKQITTEEWNKTHKVPEMVFCGDVTLNSGSEVDAYQCPDCGYVEFWGWMRKK